MYKSPVSIYLFETVVWNDDQIDHPCVNSVLTKYMCGLYNASNWLLFWRKKFDQSHLSYPLFSGSGGGGGGSYGGMGGGGKGRGGGTYPQS